LKLNIHPLFLLCGLTPLPLIFVAKKYKKQLLFTSLCVITLLCGVFRAETNLQTLNDPDIRLYVTDEVVEIRGTIYEDPDARENITHLYLQALEIDTGVGSYEISGNILLYVPPFPEYEYGDYIQVIGKLQPPPQFEDFDYADYLSRQGIHTTMLYPQIDVLGSGNGSKLMTMIYSFRNNLSQTLESILPEPQASLTQGIILGIRGNIPSSVKSSFALTGTSHLLAISGLHLSIITGLFLSIGRYLFGRRHNIYAWLTLGTIWVYALLTGMHAPVFRAALMLSLFIFAEILGRQKSVTTSLAFAVAIMVGINPQILWDASFQLSLLAMLGLIYIAPLLRSAGRNFINIPRGMDGAKAAISGFLIDSLAVTLGVIITVWPVIAHYFGVVSLVSPLATLLTLPALPAIIVTGMLHFWG